jgi:hypothetical protein
MKLACVILFATLASAELFRIERDASDLAHCSYNEFIRTKIMIMKQEFEVMQELCVCFVYQNKCLGDLEKLQVNRSVFRTACGIGFVRDNHGRCRKLVKNVIR